MQKRALAAATCYPSGADDRLVYIPDRIKSLQRELDDLEWNGGRDTVRGRSLAGEIKHLKALRLAGAMYEPTF